MSAKSKAEGQRILSQILTAKRKEDPRGLLLAQRNGTLNEYLREDLAKHGLAVAGGTVPRTGGAGGASASGARSSGGTSKTPASASASAALSAVASKSSQRHSYKAPSASANSAAGSASPPGPPAANSGARGCLASLGQIDGGGPLSKGVPSPPVESLPQPPQQHQREQAAGVIAGKPTPGKLAASRFGSFVKGDGDQNKTPSAAAPEATPGRPSDPPRRWTLGPDSSPTTGASGKAKELEQHPREPEGEVGESSSEASTTATSESASASASSVQELTSRFGGLSAGSGSGSGTGGGGKRSTSGKIAELTRKFEK